MTADLPQFFESNFVFSYSYARNFGTFAEGHIWPIILFFFVFLLIMIILPNCWCESYLSFIIIIERRWSLSFVSIGISVSMTIVVILLFTEVTCAQPTYDHSISYFENIELHLWVIKLYTVLHVVSLTDGYGRFSLVFVLTLFVYFCHALLVCIFPQSLSVRCVPLALNSYTMQLDGPDLYQPVPL